MNQEINFGTVGREKLFNGVKIVASAVKSTLGPGGRNCIFSSDKGTRVTKDGVTVADQINLDDKQEMLGVDLIREAARKTAHDAGDGTTTATILTEKIVEEGNKLLALGYNGISLQRGIKHAADVIVKYIKDEYCPQCPEPNMREVALVSTNWDKEIADLIAEAVEKAGENGVITAESSRSTDSYVLLKEGQQYDRGFYSNYFINDRMQEECVLENPVIFMTDQKITNLPMAISIVEAWVKNTNRTRPLLIICPEVEAEALNFFIINKVRGMFNGCVIKCPGYGERQSHYLTDLTASLGGSNFDKLTQREFKSAELKDYGSCDKVVINKDTTTFIGGHGDKELIDAHIKAIKADIEKDPDSWTSHVAQERIAKMTNGIAIVYVGANSESELKERLDRVDDAICACKAAAADGILPGGGSVLAKVSKAKLNFNKGTDSFNAGVSIVIKALTAPIRQLLNNAGSEDTDVIISKVASAPLTKGYDINTFKMVDLFESGIVDPTNVTCNALTNAATAAGLILTTECVITSETEKKES